MADTGWKYAQTVNPQVNPNLKKREKWTNWANAVGKSDKYATSHYTYEKDKKGNKIYNHPYKVTAHDFRLNIPDGAYITDVIVQVSMKASKKGVATFPTVGFYIADRKADVKESKKETGWHNGIFWNRSTRQITKSSTHATYHLLEENFKKGKYTVDELNSTYFGVDLDFNDECDNVAVYLEWVRVKVEYEVPDLSLTHNKSSNKSAPTQITTGQLNKVVYTLKNKTRANAGTQCLKLDVPYGTSLISAIASSGSFNTNTNIWSVKCGSKASATLTLNYIDYTIDTQKINLKGTDCSTAITKIAPSSDFYYTSNKGAVDDFGELTTRLITSPVRKRHDTCFLVDGTVETSSDTTIRIDINAQDGFQYENLGEDNTLSYSLDENISRGLSVNEVGSNYIVFDVDEDKRGDVLPISFSYCIRPLNLGDYYMVAMVHGGGENNPAQFTVLDSYEYHFGSKTVFDESQGIANYLFNREIVGFFNHRIASQLETGAYVLPCRVKEHDSLMTQSKPNIHMYKWEQLDYIGCVPLEHLHFDPKSTYKDKLLDTQYKNKRYMGKELASDEDITLNVRLHPQQVTTMQGLIDMDKPIPINANHRCFEGDALNHRGWAEIYGITSTLTNPHWYKCDIDVKYLTHNLNTRFKINAGDKTFNEPMPTVLLESVESGDALSSIGQEETTEGQEVDYFVVDTDGGYIYNSEAVDTEYLKDDDDKLIFYVIGDASDLVARIYELYGEDNVNITHCETDDEFDDYIDSLIVDGYTIINANIGEPISVDNTEYTNANQRNVFTLDEGQYFSIKSRDILSTVSQVSCDWAITKIDEDKENTVSKIVRLIDKDTNNVMFEYEYTDFDYSDYDSTDDLVNSQIGCHVIGRAYRKGDYEEVISEDIKVPIVDDADADDEETDVDVLFGSNVSFQLNGNTLSVLDTGYTGKALSRTGIELEGESYYYEVEFRNRNTDGETGDLTAFIDIVVQDSLLASQYASKYGNMIVSPFPVADKHLIFSRDAEEGVIYYYENDKEEFSYLIEPYYQYHNGVDLRTSVDSESYISIFNLNYGYRTIYLENGLVSLGINRLTGHMYLRKWDTGSKEYITLFTFQLNHYDDVNINSINDDKIELQASNTLISMYRGHPYVILKHETEDIDIIDKFGRVWAETVGDDSQPYPTYFDLLNTSNMLPECVGGVKTLDDACVEVFECGDTGYVDCPDLTDTSIALDLENTIYEDTETDIGVTSEDLVDGDLIYYIIDGDVVDTPVAYPSKLAYTFGEPKEYEVSAVFIGDDTRSYAVADTVTIHAEQVPIVDPPTPPAEDEDCQPTTGKYKLTISSPSTFTYRDKQKVTFRLTRGGLPVCSKTIEMVDFKYINTAITSRSGYASFTNNHISSDAGSYKIGARFFEGRQQICKVFKDVKVKKATVEWVQTATASNVNDTARFKLRAVYNKGESTEWYREIANTKVTLYLDGKAYSKKTNANGNISVKVKKKGNRSFKCSFAGDKNHKKAVKTFKNKVRN